MPWPGAPARTRPRKSSAPTDEQGVRFRFEPPWADLFGVETTANPDFLVDPDGVRAICEVKHSERTKVWDQLLAAPETAMPVAPEDASA